MMQHFNSDQQMLQHAISHMQNQKRNNLDMDNQSDSYPHESPLN